MRPALARQIRAARALPACLQTRGLVQIPHPDLAAPGARRFAVRGLEPYTSVVHWLAAVRALESRLGSPIIELDLPKDGDTLRPSGIMFVTTLKPVTLGRDVVLEVRRPTLSTGRGMNGGPTLADVTAALTSKGAAEGKAEGTMRFRVEVQNREPRAPRARQQKVSPSPAERREDEAVVKALQRFGEGFFGGFKDVAEGWKGLVRDKAEAAEVEPVAPLAASEVTEVEQPRRRVKKTPVPEVAITEPEPESVDAPEETRSRADKLKDKALEAARTNLKLQEEARLRDDERKAEEAAREQEEAKDKEEVEEPKEGEGAQGWNRWFKK